MHYSEYVSYDGLGLANLVKRQEIQAAELLSLAQARADACQDQLNAIVRRIDHYAQRQAQRTFDKAMPFAGVPFLVKDLHQEIAGFPSAGGCRALKRLPATFTADVVKRWEAAGVVIFGMTNTPELGSKGVTEPRAFGLTRNPWDVTRTPGGSSGGSAAAIAAGIVPLAGANDGGGSIRIPAAACGLFGLKVGRGLISVGPAMGEAINGTAVQGVLTRSVRDCAAMLDVMQGPEPHAPYFIPPPNPSYQSLITAPPRPLKIGFSTESPLGTPVSPEAVQAVAEAGALLESLGHTVEAAAPAINGEQVANDFAFSWCCEVAAAVARVRALTGAGEDRFESDTRLLAALGRSITAPELIACRDRWQTHVQQLAAFHEQYDLWLTPTLSEPAVKLGALDTPQLEQMLSRLVGRLRLGSLVLDTPQYRERMRVNLAWVPYTQLANLTGRPAMSVPLYWTPNGLPLGVHFTGPLGSEGLMLQLAAQLEQASPWFTRLPALTSTFV